MSHAIEAPNNRTYPYNPRYLKVLQYNPATDEPYIALPAPHSNIRLTPARMDDAEAILPIMNSSEVAMNFTSPPFPYLREHCDAWLRDRLRDYAKAMVGIKNVHGDIGYLDVFPLRHIREIAPDGSETFLGDVGLMREDTFEHIDDRAARDDKVHTNLTLPPGDPSIVWSISDYLRPSHHKRGIMTAVVKTIIDSWAVPHMNARKLHASAFIKNTGSHKVFLRNGFRLGGTIIGVVQFPENKGGQLMDCAYFDRDIVESGAANADG